MSSGPERTAHEQVGYMRAVYPPFLNTHPSLQAGGVHIKALEREVRELRQANEILRKASAYFAQAELDRRFKP